VQIQQAQGRAAVPVDLMVGPSEQPSYHGSLIFLDNSVDRTNGTIMMRAVVSNPDRALLPGQSVRVRLHIGDEPNALLVPATAVGTNRAGSYVYLIGRGDRIEQRYVTLGRGYGSDVVVLHGLRAGEYVLVEDLLQATPGRRVRPVLQD